MKWLKNFERLQELQQQIIWRPITELEPRSFIPEVFSLCSSFCYLPVRLVTIKNSVVNFITIND